MVSDAERARLHARFAMLLPNANQLSDESVRKALAGHLGIIQLLAVTDRFDFYHPELTMNHVIHEGLLVILSATLIA